MISNVLKKHTSTLIMRGQSMVEVLVALAAAVIILTSITVSVITSMSNTSYGSNQNAATQYAQESIDVVRKMRDTNYSRFVETSSINRYCMGEDNNLSDRNDCIRSNIGIFQRTIEFDSNSENCGSTAIRVKAVVAWSDSKCENNAFCHDVELVSCLSDINAIPTP